MWDITFGSKKRRGSIENHVPAYANVLWLDGSVSSVHGKGFGAIGLPYVPEGYDFTPPVYPTIGN